MKGRNRTLTTTYNLGTLAMATLPKNQVKTQLINALHFRRGVRIKL